MTDSPVILHQEADWLILNKPAGWHTVVGRGESPDVETWLRAAVPACETLDEAGLTHRLDLWTSGCLLVATSSSMRNRLRDAMSGRGDIPVQKRYLARCRSGIPMVGAFELFFTKRHRGSRKVTVGPSGAARDCGRCRWQCHVQDAVCGDLIEVEILGPGRRHIIRAGFAHVGHPLIGDALYGEAEGTPQLHAASLTVDRVRVEAPVPDWAQAS